MSVRPRFGKSVCLSVCCLYLTRAEKSSFCWAVDVLVVFWSLHKSAVFDLPNWSRLVSSLDISYQGTPFCKVGGAVLCTARLYLYFRFVFGGASARLHMHTSCRQTADWVCWSSVFWYLGT